MIYPRVKQKNRDCGFYALSYAINLEKMSYTKASSKQIKNNIKKNAKELKLYKDKFNNETKLRKKIITSSKSKTETVKLEIMHEEEFFNIDALYEFSQKHAKKDIATEINFTVEEFKDASDLFSILENNPDTPFLFPHKGRIKNKEDENNGLHWGVVIYDKDYKEIYLIQTAKGRHLRHKCKLNGPISHNELYNSNNSLKQYNWSKHKYSKWKCKQNNIDKINILENLSMNKNKMLKVENKKGKEKNISFCKKFNISFTKSLKNKKKSLKEIILEKPILFLILCIGFIVALFFGYHLFDKIIDLLSETKNTFFDKEGNFEWISISAIIAVIGLFTNASFNRKKFKADLISKSRIEWLITTRNLSSEVVTNSYMIASKINTILNNFSMLEKLEAGKGEFLFDNKDEGLKKINKHNLKLSNEINLCKAVLLEKTTLFKLYFGPNDENDKLVSQSDEIQGFCDELIELYLTYTEKATSKSIEQILEVLEIKLEKGQNITDKFSDECRKYFKIEWDKAKSGK